MLLGASVTLDTLSIGAFYGKVLTAKGSPSLEMLDGDDGYGLPCSTSWARERPSTAVLSTLTLLASGGFRGSKRNDRRFRHHFGVLGAGSD